MYILFGKFGLGYLTSCVYQFIGDHMEEMPNILQYFCFLDWECVLKYNIMLHMFLMDGPMSHNAATPSLYKNGKYVLPHDADTIVFSWGFA